MPAEPDDFERAWARIVADLTSGGEPIAADLPDLSDLAGHPAGSALSPGTDDAGDRPTPDPGGGLTAEPPDERVTPSSPGAPTDPLGRSGSARWTPGGIRPGTPGTPADPATPTDPGEFVGTWADEGHFTPPPPPDIPEGTPITRLGWAGTLGGPLVLIVLTLTGWDVPRAVPIAAGVATLAGFITLVWQLPQSRDDGWDDGAQV